jgi:serine/threonine protein phosphatase PrpC
MTRAAGNVNGDAVGVNGWVASGRAPAAWAWGHPAAGAEAFAVADGIQPGYGALGAQLVAARASKADLVRDSETVAATLAAAHAELTGESYFADHWDVQPDRLRLPGTTVAGCRVEPADASLLIFNVGDSGVFLVDGAHLGKQSIDDRLGTGLLTQAVGGGPPGDPAPHIVKVKLGSKNRVLLCSDGLTDMLPHPELERLVARPPTAERAVEALMRLCHQLDTGDDVTALVLDVDWAENRPRSRFRGWGGS